MSRTALVLGTGIGGIVAAETLRKLLPASDRVITVDRAGQHFFPPSLLWLMVGERNPEEFSRPLDRLLRRGIELRQGSVTRIDPARREVEIPDPPFPRSGAASAQAAIRCSCAPCHKEHRSGSSGIS